MSRAVLLSLSLVFTRCAPSTSAEACVDAWLAERGLDAYGNPQGTTYAGGNPLRDERTGRELSREEYVVEHHPELREACLTPPST